MKRSLPKVAVCLLCLTAPGAVTGCGKDTDETASPAPVVSWDDAASHVAQYVTVEGPVVTGHYANRSRGQPTFLDLGKPYPDPKRFVVLIWGSDRGNFPQPPESMYIGKTIRVTGTITMYRGVPQIVVKSPDTIKAE